MISLFLQPFVFSQEKEDKKEKLKGNWNIGNHLSLSMHITKLGNLMFKILNHFLSENQLIGLSLHSIYSFLLKSWKQIMQCKVFLYDQKSSKLLPYLPTTISLTKYEHNLKFLNKLGTNLKQKLIYNSI